MLATTPPDLLFPHSKDRAAGENRSNSDTKRQSKQELSFVFRYSQLPTDGIPASRVRFVGPLGTRYSGKANYSAFGRLDGREELMLIFAKDRQIPRSGLTAGLRQENAGPMVVPSS
jgi:hypothetical protein